MSCIHSICTLCANWYAYAPRHVPSNVKHWPDVTQAAFHASIMQPTASEHLALAVPPPGLGCIPALLRLEGDAGKLTPAYSTLDAGWALPSHPTLLPLSSFALVLSLTIWGASYVSPGQMRQHRCDCTDSPVLPITLLVPGLLSQATAQQSMATKEPSSPCTTCRTHRTPASALALAPDNVHLWAGHSVARTTAAYVAIPSGFTAAPSWPAITLSHAHGHKFVHVHASALVHAHAPIFACLHAPNPTIPPGFTAALS